MEPNVTFSSLTANQSSRLAAYFAAGVAASMGATSEAEASIVYFPVDPAKVVVTGSSFEGINFANINLTNATYSFNDFSYPIPQPAFGLFLEGQSFVIGRGGYGIDFAVASASEYDYTAIRFNYNDPIGGTLEFAAQGQGMNDSNGWLPGTTGYIGLEMNLIGQLHYGWARLNYGPNLEDPVTISGFAFESEAGTSIPAGVVPEPSTVALAGVAALVLGGSAYMRSRRRREEEQKEAA